MWIRSTGVATCIKMWRGNTSRREFASEIALGVARPSGVDPGFWSGGPAEFWPQGWPWAQNELTRGFFPLKLPENYMILKKFCFPVPFAISTLWNAHGPTVFSTWVCTASIQTVYSQVLCCLLSPFNRPPTLVSFSVSFLRRFLLLSETCTNGQPSWKILWKLEHSCRGVAHQLGVGWLAHDE